MEKYLPLLRPAALLAAIIYSICTHHEATPMDLTTFNVEAIYCFLDMVRDKTKRK